MNKKRIYEIDENAFSKISPESAYWLGFIAADGCIMDRKRLANKNWKSSKIISFCLHPRDENHLEKFKLFLKSNHPIRHEKNNRCVYFEICSETMFKDLLRWGIKPKKTYSLMSHVEMIPDEYKSYFICGLIDGDGSFIIRNKKVDIYEYNICTVRLLSNIATLKDISKYLNNYHNISFKKIQKTNSKFAFIIDFCSKSDIQSFFNLYESCPIHLDRKYFKIKKWMKGGKEIV